MTGDRPSPNAPRWRVDYHLWAAGGRLKPHSREVRALSAADAIADAERLERACAARAGRSCNGYFKDATAERLMSLDPATEKDPRLRPCENPECRAIDSTRCAFKINERTGNVVKRQQEEAKAAGCRVVRFADGRGA